MKEQLNALYALQSFDVQIARANAGLAAMDGAIAQRKKYAAGKKQSEAAAATLLEEEVELKDSELKLKSIDAKRTATEKKLYGGMVSSPKELSSLEKEIEHLKGQQSQLDGRVLELYDSVEALREKAKAAKALKDSLEQQARAAMAKEAVERKRLEAEVAELEPLRELMAGKVTDKQLMSRYEAIRKKTGGTAVAKIIEHKCGGCHVAVTTFTIRNIFEEKGIEYCENCGQILMLDTE